MRRNNALLQAGFANSANDFALERVAQTARLCRVCGGRRMDQLKPLIDTVSNHPMLAAGVAVGVAALYALLHRKPRIQRDADSRLSALRRDKADLYRNPRL
jgi:hypothetical protein